MSILRAAFWLAVLAVPWAAAHTQVLSTPALRLMQKINNQPGELARYVYLLKASGELQGNDLNLALQFLSFTQCELGVYTQAVLSFPLRARLPEATSLPTPAQWRAVPAVDAIAKLAHDRRLVLINEAHHNAQTRQLTLALLPRLRAMGFNYFAAEALLADDTNLTARGYPVSTSGTEYLREPIYGEIVRTALRLGFHVIAYDQGGNRQAREDAQAEKLYRAVFAHDPTARLFVHAGYAHIDKSTGRLGAARPMAMRLRELSGIEPLSIDQTEILETDWDATDAWHRLAAAFPAKYPQIFLERANGTPWSARPATYDVSVLLPPALSMAAFGDLHAYGGEMASKLTTLQTRQGSPLASAASNVNQRPTWLTLGGARRPVPINATLCRGTVPCLVTAQYADESTDAIAADRYAFLSDHAATSLYLYPGRYHLQATDVRDRTLSTQTVTVEADRP